MGTNTVYAVFPIDGLGYVLKEKKQLLCRLHLSEKGQHAIEGQPPQDQEGPACDECTRIANLPADERPKVDNTLPPVPAKPDNTLPGDRPKADNTLPGDRDDDDDAQPKKKK